MWITPDGRLHSVQLPDPRILMTERFECALRLLVESHGRQLEEAVAQGIDEEADRECEECIAEPEIEARFVGEIPPPGVLDSSPTGVPELIASVMMIEVRWRLDVFSAVESFIDHLLDPDDAVEWSGSEGEG